MATQIDLQTVANRIAAGETIPTIATSLGVKRQTLYCQLVNAGFVQRIAKGSHKSPSAKPAAKPVSKVKRARKAIKTAVETVATAVESAVQGVVEDIATAVQTVSTFVKPAWYPLLAYAMKAKKGACLFGPRGCGKSTAIRHLATELNQPTLTLQCSANMQIDSLIGTWTSKDGTLSFIDGPLTTAVRNGAWLLAEEANTIHPGVWSAVNTLTDKTGEGLRLPTGEVVNASPSFRLILLYNEGYTGTREVNPALKDRLMPIYTTYLAPADEISILQTLTGASLEDCTRVQGVAEIIRSAKLGFDLSPRALETWIGVVKDAGFSWIDGYRYAIMDLVGAPEICAAVRACLDEIARNTVAQWQTAVVDTSTSTQA